MIIKIKSLRGAKAFRNLLRYILESEERIPETHIIRHNLFGESIEELVREFEENEAGRLHKRKNNITLSHEIISFHPEDTPHLSISKLEQIAREYIEHRNPNGLYLGGIHQEAKGGNIHIHLAVSSVEYGSGLSLRMSRKELTELKQSIQGYQQTHFPELSHSLPAHGNSRQPQLTNQEYWYKQNTDLLTTKEKLFLSISLALDESSNLDEFLGKISASGLEPYFRNGVPAGVWYNGRKYRFRTLGIRKERLILWRKKEMAMSR